jgi:hypothetical protein
MSPSFKNFAAGFTFDLWIIARLLMRKRLLLLFGLLAILVAIGVLRLTTPTPGLTKENALRLRAGMTLKEVEARSIAQGRIWLRMAGPTPMSVIFGVLPRLVSLYHSIKTAYLRMHLSR